MARLSFALLITHALLLGASARVVDKPISIDPEVGENNPWEDTLSTEADSSEPEVRIQNGLPLQTPPSYAAALTNLFADSSCTASLIGPRTVLTAAHCFRGVNENSEVVLGLSNVTFANRIHHYNDPEVDIIPFNMDDFIPHPEYDDATAANDIAIIRLRRPANKKFKPVSIASYLSENMYERNLTAVGWGMKDCFQQGSDSIRQATGRYVDNEKCSEYYGKGNIKDYDLCAMFYKEPSKTTLVGVAPGDSGGPLVVEGLSGEPLQVGVASRVSQIQGTKCTNVNKPQLYARVTEFEDFIIKHLVRE